VVFVNLNYQFTNRTLFELIAADFLLGYSSFLKM